MVTTLALGLVFACGQDPPAESAPAKRLAAVVMDLSFEEAPLVEVLDAIRDAADLEFVFSETVRDPQELRVSVQLKGVRAISALRVVLGQLDLAAVLKASESIVEITTKEALERRTETRVYDVADLNFRIPDMPGPRLEFEPSPEPGRVGGVVFVMQDAPAEGLGGETLVEIIRSATGGRSWDENPNARILMTSSGLLLVTQSKPVHEEIGRLLDLLRSMR